MKINVRKVILVGLFLLLIFILRPAFLMIYVYITDTKITKVYKQGTSQDASNLNQIEIDTLVKVSSNLDHAIGQIRILIRQAAQEAKHISIAGAQHSMGGHTIYKNGILLDMKGFNYMKFDTKKNLLLVGSGALWSDVLPYLDKYGKSVAVMQSNNSFSVGGSVSVNCHGWQADSPPIASSVESFRLIDSKGRILNCSRDENNELFSLALGGYGLFGVILDLKLRVTDNKVYTASQYIVKSKDYFSAYKKHVKRDKGVEMAYGRINIDPDHFMDEAILSTFKITEAAIENKNENTYPTFRRVLFRSSVNSDIGKNWRWTAEKFASRFINDKTFIRNKLLGEGVEIFQNTDTAYTDILHEYFVPGDSLSGFIQALQKILPNYQVDLLNITVRNVTTDNDTFLSYAKEEMFGLVMLFNQKKDKNAEDEMTRLTQKLIGTSIRFKGTYYLPYRLHASKEMMYRAYPIAEVFFQLKLKHDPLEIFSNQFYEKYKLQKQVQ